MTATDLTELSTAELEARKAELEVIPDPHRTKPSFVWHRTHSDDIDKAYIRDIAICYQPDWVFDYTDGSEKTEDEIADRTYHFKGAWFVASYVDEGYGDGPELQADVAVIFLDGTTYRTMREAKIAAEHKHFRAHFREDYRTALDAWDASRKELSGIIAQIAQRERAAEHQRRMALPAGERYPFKKRTPAE